MSEILANLLVGANGATALAGRSRGLTFPADRERFHMIRSLARSIVIGGATFRAEPYRSTPVPLFVASHSLTGDGANFIAAEPKEVIERALQDCGSPVLVEGGVNFLTNLLRERLISRLYLTRSAAIGDSHFFDECALNLDYQMMEHELYEGGALEIWQVKQR